MRVVDCFGVAVADPVTPKTKGVIVADDDGKGKA
jgi:hypothetical protein